MLISAVIVSAVLLVVIIGANLTGFYTRYALLDAEFKSRSVAAANACAGEALLRLAQDAGYSGGLVLSLNSFDSCRVGTISGSTQKTFRVQATSSRAVTNLSVTVNSDTLSLLSYSEVPVF